MDESGDICRPWAGLRGSLHSITAIAGYPAAALAPAEASRRAQQVARQSNALAERRAKSSELTRFARRLDSFAMLAMTVFLKVLPIFDQFT